MSMDLRKKWGTIFMGEREASMSQLEAMQEPVRREQERQQSQEDYMERVKTRAVERARQILGEAYAERQRVLEEARRDSQDNYQRIIAEAESIRQSTRDGYEAMQIEREKARKELAEAERIRAAAHDEGYRTGMDQVAGDLQQIRYELAQYVGWMMQAVQMQMHDICRQWREELAELTRAAVSAGTGYVLGTQHEAVLRALLLDAVKQLEDRSSITVRVHPEDEEAVTDMFAAARERVPELRQWIVNTDAAMEPGGFVAESVSGSVDCRREHFRELVDNILVHLALPTTDLDRENEEQGEQLMQTLLEKAQSLGPEPAAPAAPEAPAQPSASAEAAPQQAGPQQVETGEQQVEAQAAPATAPVAPAAEAGEPLPPAPVEQALPPEPLPEAVLPPDEAEDAALLQSLDAEEAALLPDDADIDSLPHDSAADRRGASVISRVSAGMGQEEAIPEAYLPPLGEDDERRIAPPPPPARSRKGDPSLEELEEELFPLEDDRDDALLQGGFLGPDSGKDKG